MKTSIRIVLSILILSLLIFIWNYWYIYYKYETNVTDKEIKKREIDEYNFKQLKKVKSILKYMPDWATRFNTLKEFNKIYSANIRPIYKCYYVSNFNGNESYIFWFELESDKYKEKYWTGYYAYPKYDIPNIPTCYWLGEWWWCHDKNRERFEWIIKNPCRD